MDFFSMFDPTSSSSPFGGAVANLISNLPGGSDVLGWVNAYNTVQGSAPATTPAPAPAPVPWYARPSTLLAAGAAVLALVLALVFVRRR